MTGRPATCGRTCAPSAAASRAQLEHPPPRLGIVVVLRERERDRPADRGRELAHPRHLALGRGEVFAERARGRELEHAGAELAEHAADAEQLVLGRERAGHRLAVDRHVRDRAARREAERAGLDAFAHDRAPSPRCRRASRARSSRRAPPSRSRAPRRAAPACRRRAASASRSTASRYSGNVSHSHWMPADSAAPGMSSTPSIRPMSQSCLSGCTGAKPTPQLPITTVVTPCQHVGVSSGSQVTWPSKCVCTSTKPGVTSAPSASIVSRARAVDRADLGDDAVGDRDVGGARRRAGAVDDRAALDHEIVHVLIAPLRRTPGRLRPGDRAPRARRSDRHGRTGCSARRLNARLGVRPRDAEHLLGEHRGRGRHRDVLADRAEAVGALRLAVEADRRVDRLRHPVDGEVREDLIARDRVFGVAVVVGPRAELLDDPTREPGRRIGEAVAERLRVLALDLLVRGAASVMNSPAAARSAISSSVSAMPLASAGNASSMLLCSPTHVLGVDRGERAPRSSRPSRHPARRSGRSRGAPSASSTPRRRAARPSPARVVGPDHP